MGVQRSIWIDAPAERVWRAVTDPAQIEQWFSPGTAWGASDLEVGGRLFVVDPETGAEAYPQVIEELDAPHRLVTRTADGPPNPVFVIRNELHDEAGGTRLTVTDLGYEQLAGDQRDARMEQDAFGFGMMLENTKAYLEGRELPYPGGF